MYGDVPPTTLTIATPVPVEHSGFCTLVVTTIGVLPHCPSITFNVSKKEPGTTHCPVGGVLVDC